MVGVVKGRGMIGFQYRYTDAPSSCIRINGRLDTGQVDLDVPSRLS